MKQTKAVDTTSVGWFGVLQYLIFCWGFGPIHFHWMIPYHMWLDSFLVLLEFGDVVGLVNVSVSQIPTVGLDFPMSKTNYPLVNLQKAIENCHL